MTLKAFFGVANVQRLSFPPPQIIINNAGILGTRTETWKMNPHESEHVLKVIGFTRVYILGNIQKI